MLPLKRAWSRGESSPDADEERYSRNSTLQHTNSGEFVPIHNLPFDPSHSGTWDLFPATQHGSNTTSEFAFREDGYALSWESIVLDSAQSQYDQTTRIPSSNDFIPTIPNNHDQIWSYPPQLSTTVSSGLQSFSSSATTVNASSSQDLIEISYGTLDRIRVRLAGDMLQLEHKLQRTEASYGFGFVGFQIRPGKEEITLHFADGTLLGSINIQFFRSLQAVIPASPIRMEAIANIANVRDCISKAKKASDAIVRVDINVFGPESDAAIVGKKLSDEKLWLQKPMFLKKGVKYENPQFLKLEGFEQHEVDQQPLEMSSSQKTLPKDDEMFKEAIEDVFNKLTRSAQLQRVEKDRRVTTELLPHQEEGLSFMIQRETGEIPERYRLWKREEDKGVVLFRHAVTGGTSHIQYPESGGGVLADDMGMGKSLSILSLVAKTSDQAEDWIHGSQEALNEILESWKTRSKATLIIVSSGLLINEWIHEMNKHLDGSISFVRYHGMKRKSLKGKLQAADIILTTYQTLARDFQHKQRRNHESILHEIDFFRVVLDEAHIIRRKGTLFSSAVSALSAKSRWCLTGTPIQNKFEDIGALFAFIRARPFHNIATKRLVSLIDSLCIRRTKARLRLPETQDLRKELVFSEVERRQYDKAISDMSRRLRQQVGNSKSMHDFGMFQIKIQLRILCNHGTYQDPFAWIHNAWLDVREYALTSMVATGEVVCSYCRQNMPVTSARNIYRMYEEQCKHAICDLCSGTALDEDEDENVEIRCPICAHAESLRGVKTYTAARKVIDKRYFQPNGFSTKITQLVNDLQENLQEKKSIVFSCWTKTLELISQHLKAAGIVFERIDGGISLHKREENLKAFAESDELPVLIMTTGTGAYGLNLTAANRIFIVEPQWNPAVENQAVSRAIRLGQTEGVQVTRYIMKDTVEQEMRSQQNQKIMIAGILDQSASRASEEPGSEDVATDMTMTNY